jgi:hypothetical protein
MKEEHRMKLYTRTTGATKVHPLTGVGLVAMLLLGDAGCLSWTHDGHALLAASTSWNCPTDQIKILSVSGQQRDPPPADVRADPARLAVWQKKADPEARNYVLSGCGETATVSCTYVSSGSEEWFGCDAPPTHYGPDGGRAAAAGPFGLDMVGATVWGVAPGAPADKAGLVFGDNILEVDNQSVGQGPPAGNRINELLHVSGTPTHSLRVMRGTSTLDLTILSPALAPAATALGGAAPPRPTATQLATPGCSKDTDCKGDRVCVQGQCADPTRKNDQ